MKGFQSLALEERVWTSYLHFKDSPLGYSVDKGPEAAVVGGRETRSPLEDANQSQRPGPTLEPRVKLLRILTRGSSPGMEKSQFSFNVRYQASWWATPFPFARV